jgi:hypothetical protein
MMKTKWLAASVCAAVVTLGACRAQAQTVYVAPLEVDWFDRCAWRGGYSFCYPYPYPAVYSTRSRSYNPYVEDPRDQYKPYIYTRYSPGGRVYQNPGYLAEEQQRFSVGGRPMRPQRVTEW